MSSAVLAARLGDALALASALSSLQQVVTAAGREPTVEEIALAETEAIDAAKRAREAVQRVRDEDARG